MANTVSVSAIRDASRAITNTWATDATRFLGILESQAGTLLDVILPDVDFSIPDTPFESTLFNRLGQEPSVPVGSLFVSPSTEPGAFSSFTTVDTPELVPMPGFDLASPAINLPTAPELEVPSVPAAPVVDQITLPVSPVLDLPTAPTLESVVFPDAPTLSLPTFSEAAPQAPTSFLQTTTFSFQDEAFDEELLNSIRSKLRTDVTAGGYGIEPDDEEALWARSRDREMTQLEAAETEVADRFARAGYFVPPGAMLAAFNQVRSDAENRLSEANRQISTTRAQLFRDNRQFAMQQGLSVEEARMRHWGFRMERALNAQRFAAEFGIAVHDASIRKFNAELQRYLGIAQVHRDQLQAALTQIQIFEAEVRAAVARQESNRLDVELHQALLQAANTRVQLFESQLRAASIAADLQRLKVDVYRSEIEAFTSRVQANESQFRTFESGIRGEQAKVDIFRAEVAAFSDRVRAAGIEQSARNERTQAQISKRREELNEYQAAIQRHQTNVQAESERVRALLQRYSTDTNVFQAAVAGYDALTRVALTESQAQIQAIQEQTRRLQTNANMELEAVKASLTAQFNAANAGAEISTGVISAVESTFRGFAIENQET